MSPDADTAATPPPVFSPTPSPTLTVVKGDPTAEELAALIAVLASVTGPTQDRTGPSDAGSRPRSGWAARGSGVRTPLTPGPGAWRAAAR